MDDILLCIFDYIPLTDIVKCFPVSKQFNKIASHNLYWNQLLKINFNHCFLENNCKDKYRQYTVLDKFLLKTTKSGITKSINSRQLHLGYPPHIPIPIEINLLVNLRKLFLNQNRMESLPTHICLLTNLELLSICNNKLTSLPPEIGLLTNLRVLDLSYNKLSILPSQIGCLFNLRVISLYRNPLIQLLQEMGSLPKLENVYINRIQIELVPNSLFKYVECVEEH